MLGEPGHKGTMVNQASWVRSLLASFVKSWAGRGTGIGGIFGSLVGENKTVLPWTRAEQAAFLIVAYELLQNSVYKTDTKWTKALRDQGLPDLFDDNDDMAFYGPNSLINQDQGVRTILQVVNDLVYVSADDLSLIEWGGQHQDGSDDDRIKDAVSSLKKKRKILSFLKSLMQSLSTFDWRASSAPGLSEDEIIYKAALRGGGGYKLLRTQVLQHLAKSKGPAKLVAKDVLKSLDY